MAATDFGTIYRIGVITNALPSLDFVSLKFQNAERRVIVTLTVAALSLINYIVVLYKTSADRYMQRLDKFLVILGDSLMLLQLTIYHLSINPKNLTKLVPTIASFPKVKTNSNYIILMHLAFISTALIDLIASKADFVYHVLDVLHLYCLLIQVLLTIEILSVLRAMIENTFAMTKETLDGFLLIPEAHLQETKRNVFVMTGWAKSALKTQPKYEDICRVRISINNYKEIRTLMKRFNKTFGWSSFLAVLAILSKLALIQNQIQQRFAHKINTKIFISEAPKVILFLILYVKVALICDEISAKIKGMVDYSFGSILAILENNVGCLERKLIFNEIYALWYLLGNSPGQQFTFGLIAPQRKTLFGLLTLPIAIQLFLNQIYILLNCTSMTKYVTAEEISELINL